MRTVFLLASAAALCAQTARIDCASVSQWGEHRFALSFRTGPAAGWTVGPARLIIEAPLPPRTVEAGVSKRMARMKAAAAAPGFTAVELPPALAAELLSGRAARLYVRGFKRIGRSCYLNVEEKKP